MTSITTPRFTPQAIAFLRALKRNNNREWFKARKDRYDTLLRDPMTALIERLARDFEAFAPDLIANPKASLYRIYRDTRFSENKAPLKTHVAAVFPCRGLAKHQGAGLYLEVATDWVWVGGGFYAPESSELQAIREHIAANLRRFRTIVESPGFRRSVGRLSGEQLQRAPRGFPQDHEAAEYLRFRQFLAGREFPASFASNPRFYRGVVDTFRKVAPLTRFINEPLLNMSGPGSRVQRLSIESEPRPRD
jgi:uncharacterized protein (TIGR02453 family)